jgi:hypothetical protein
LGCEIEEDLQSTADEELSKRILQKNFVVALWGVMDLGSACRMISEYDAASSFVSLLL